MWYKEIVVTFSVSLHVCVCVLWSSPKFRRVWPWVVPRNEAETFLKGKPLVGKQLGGGMGLNQAWIAVFALAPSMRFLLLEFFSCWWSSHSHQCLNCTLVWVPFILRVQHRPAKIGSLRKLEDKEYGWMESVEIHVICKFKKKKKSTWLFLASAQPSPC